MSLPDSVRGLVEGLGRPLGVPSLAQPLVLALVLIDAPGRSFVIEVGCDWSIALSGPVDGVVYDAALALPASLAVAALTGAVDLGEAARHGRFTGSMASQSAYSFIVERVAERWIDEDAASWQPG